MTSTTDGAESQDPGEGDRLDTVQQRRRSPDRVVALSDGVFAIVLTILVLEIAVPAQLSDASLADALEELQPTFVAWVISFLITGMYWVGHRDLFTHVQAVNRDLVWLNLLFLLPASMIPFAASLLGEYPDEVLALHLYGAVVIAVSFMRLVLYGYVVRRPELLWDDVSDKSTLGLVLAGIPIAVYLVAIAIAPTSPTASRCVFFAVPLLYFLLVTVLRERPRTRAEADDFS